ncbi:serine--tRNA synthetase-like protein Slimp [Limulus polyphemus]|uniref:Serine--tRNA synthetase-like protein Slimp n=1 Tax=Limulus polyphemus TaxID=6850 RepID=A0ABM1BJ30_LIMPO|nr:serine--tRNA synthetase-like protein Slimp [Limulus polyphemus]
MLLLANVTITTKIIGYRLLLCFVPKVTSVMHMNFSHVSYNYKAFIPSTLYVSGRYGKKIFPVVSPNLDLDFYLKNWENLQKMSELRGTKLPDLTDTLIQIVSLKKQLQELLRRKENISQKLQELSKTNHITSEEKENWKVEGRKVREEIKHVTEKMWDYEDDAIPVLLSIPNNIHPDTPLQDDDIIGNFCSNNQDNCIQNLKACRSHLQVLPNDIQFSNVSPCSYYLTRNAALLELALIYFFSHHLADAGLTEISCPDIVKSVIVEGCGNSFMSSISLISEQKGAMSILTGGASFESLIAYFTRSIVEKTSLPLTFFSVGRCYQSLNPQQLTIPGLFSVPQRTEIHFIIACEESNEKENFGKLVTLLQQCYSLINLPFRIKKLASKNLGAAESLRIEFEVWAPALNDYALCATIIRNGEYISKRLMMRHCSKGNPNGFLHLIHGTVVSIPTLIAAIIENCQTSDCSFVVPKVLQSYMLS